jgi:endonuclease/exonuclease/phosphatase family metal-dependent hydrolase
MNEGPDLLKRLRVLTLNVWVNNARENSKNQIRSIRELNPDVIFLQEVFHIDVLEAYRTGFPDYHLVAFHRAHNVAAVIAVVALYLLVAAFFAAAILLVEKLTTNDIWRAIWTVSIPVMMAIYARFVRHHWTIAFLTGNRTGLALLLRRDLVDVQESQCVVYSRAGHVGDLLNILRPRGFISVVARLKLPGTRCSLPVRFVTTHLNQPLEQSLGDGRHRQVKEVFNRCLQNQEFLVLGGDFNATPPGTNNGSDCNTYRDLTHELSDAWADTNPSDPMRDGLTWDQEENHMSVSPLNALWWGSALIRWRCDYIFWRHQKGAANEVPTKYKTVSPPPLCDKPAATEEAQDCKVSLQACSLAFTGDAAVSDHYGVHAVFDIMKA